MLPHEFEVASRNDSAFHVAARKAELMDRWAEFDAEESSPSPPPTPQHGTSQTHADEVEDSGACSAAASLSSAGSRSSRANYCADDPEQHEKFRLPKFSEQLQRGKPWPFEYENAFIDFIAKDATLRGFMTIGTGEGTNASLRRFCALVEGPALKSLRKKLSRLREAHEILNKGLTMAARSTPSFSWSNPDDRSWLAQCEARRVSPWLRTLHDQVFVEYHKGARRRSNQPRQSASRPRVLSDASGANAAPLLSSSTAKVVSSFAGGQTGNRKPATASESAFPLPSSSHAQVSSADARFARVKAQLSEQGQQLSQLERQGEAQTQLLARQSQLLERQARHAERAAHQAEVREQLVARQLEVLERIQQHVASLTPLDVKRRQ